MAAPSNFNPDIHIDWGWALAAKGKTDAQIADEFGVSVRTVHRWKWDISTETVPVLDGDGMPVKDEYGIPKVQQKKVKTLSAFGKALVTAKEIADAKAEKSLYLLCTGYDAVDEEKILEYKTDGTVKPVKVRTTKRHIKPDVMAIMYWLNNRSRRTGEWSQRQAVTVDGGLDIRAQDKKVRQMLDSLSDEQLEQYEALCEVMEKQT